MPAVFVHGSPETAEVWTSLRSGFHRSDVILLSLPGFGSPRPAGFGSTKEEYTSWLIDELERLGEPVDLVGHDWGGLLALRVASLRGDLLRSWASDVLSFLDERYEWHDIAKAYQTPGVGERSLKARLDAPVEAVAARYQILGGGEPLSREAALMMARWLDPTMADSMLALYRSAADIPAAWAADLGRVTAPGLSIHATADPFVNADFERRVAARLDARTAKLEGLGHWWMLQDPARSAHILEAFWRSIR
jgi:pimeloyl-ACP methyl ester carboxylesterase